MKNLIIFISIITLASCQKDFYLDDLDAANRKIELQENAIYSLQNTINELTLAIANDQITINTLTTDLLSANGVIDNITIENAIQGATIDSLNTTVNTLLGNINEISTQLTNVNAELISALNTTDTQSSTIEDMKAVIADLEAEIASFVPEIVTVIEYVERYHTVVQTQTVIEEVIITNTVTNTVYIEVIADVVEIEGEEVIAYHGYNASGNALNIAGDVTDLNATELVANGIVYALDTYYYPIFRLIPGIPEGGYTVIYFAASVTNVPVVAGDTVILR